MGTDSIKKTLIVTILLSLMCSILISSVVVFLKPLQTKNIQLDLQCHILNISGLTKNSQTLSQSEVTELYKQVQSRLVDLQTGKFIEKTQAGQTADDYDQRVAAQNLDESKGLTSSEDIAGIKRRANIAKVYIIEKDDKLDTIILPVHGYGLWSKMYAFMAITSNLNTIKGFGFYEQAETPGLGGEVDNTRWKLKWPGKQIYDNKGNVAISLIKNVDPQSLYKIDALAGATLTSNGVTNLIKFWMGHNGFKQFLTNLKTGNA